AALPVPGSPSPRSPTRAPAPAGAGPRAAARARGGAPRARRGQRRSRPRPRRRRAAPARSRAPWRGAAPPRPRAAGTPAARRAPASTRAPSAGAPTTARDRARSARASACARPWSARRAGSRRLLHLRLERPPPPTLLAVAAPGRDLAPAGGAAERRRQAEVGAEGARVGLRREARVAALPVHLGPEDVHEAVARRVRGERVQRRLGLVEFAVRERRRVVDAEQDLALHGERLGPAAGGCVHVAQAAREARALGVRRPRARERVGGGAEVARALRRLGEEHEEPRLGPGLVEPVF